MFFPFPNNTSSAGVPPCSTACLISRHPSGVPSCHSPSHGVTADSRQGWNAMQPLPNKKTNSEQSPSGAKGYPLTTYAQNEAAAMRQPWAVGLSYHGSRISFIPALQMLIFTASKLQIRKNWLLQIANCSNCMTKVTIVEFEAHDIAAA